MYIPLWQPLYPLTRLSKPQGTLASMYPFNQAGACYFYYARIGMFHLARRLVELGFRKVLFPAYHHGNEVKALTAGGVELVFYNIHESTEIDYDDLTDKVHASSVLFVTHYNGFAQDVGRLLELKLRHGLILIEDVALSMFAQCRGRYLGQFGEVSIFCPYKTFPIPNGGIIVANDPRFRLSVRVREPSLVSTWVHLARMELNWLDQFSGGMGQSILRLRPMIKKALRIFGSEPVPIGDSNFNLDISNWGISAASRRIIDRSDPQGIVRARRDNYDYLDEALNRVQLEGARPLYPKLVNGAVPLFFPLRVRDREELHQRLQRRRVETSCFWRPWLSEVPAECFPEVSALRREVLELPIHQSLRSKELDYIVDQVRACSK